MKTLYKNMLMEHIHVYKPQIQTEIHLKSRDIQIDEKMAKKQLNSEIMTRRSGGTLICSSSNIVQQ